MNRGAAPRTLATGLLFPEGPVALGGGAIVFTEIQAQRLTRYADGACSPVASTGGGPNGATLGVDGALYVSNNGGLSVGPSGYWKSSDFGEGRIQRVTMEGAVTEIVTRFPGVDGAHRPNDLCFGPDGRLYFTDPANWEDIANLRPGRIWRAGDDGSAQLLAEVALFPNGIGFGADGDTLYVAQSVTQKVLAFPWRPDGLGDPTDFCTLPQGFPDGFCFSADGDLFVCGSMGHVICRFDAEGALKETIETPPDSHPTNCCLDDGSLYVTMSESGELVAFDVGAEPLALFPFR